jgi:hypothetical protein
MSIGRMDLSLLNVFEAIYEGRFLIAPTSIWGDRTLELPTRIFGCSAQVHPLEGIFWGADVVGGMR